MFVHQTWKEPRLKLPNDIFEEGDDYVTLPPEFFENLWQPELQIQNSKIAGTAHQYFSHKTVHFSLFLSFSSKMWINVLNFANRNCDIDAQIFIRYFVQKQNGTLCCPHACDNRMSNGISVVPDGYPNLSNLHWKLWVCGIFITIFQLILISWRVFLTYFVHRFVQINTHLIVDASISTNIFTGRWFNHLFIHVCAHSFISNAKSALAMGWRRWWCRIESRIEAATV